MYLCKALFFLIALSIVPCWGDEEEPSDRVDLAELSQETLFVSLGSYCGPAGLSLSSGLRKAAFPFDWNVSFDGEKLIELLEDDFLHFLDDDYLLTDDFLIPFASGILLNIYYHIEFVHEGVFKGPDSLQKLELMKEKYRRRIDRFRNLREYSGKVYFMRAGHLDSLTDHNRVFKNKDNIEISPEYSLRLYKTLKMRFPKLNFSLIIINPPHPQQYPQEIEEESRILDNLILVRAPIENAEQMQEAYKKFFFQLLKEDALSAGVQETL